MQHRSERKRPPYHLHRLVELRVPILVQVGGQTVPEERVNVTAIVCRTMIPALWKTFNLHGEEVPDGGLLSYQSLSEVKKIRMEPDPTFLLQFPDSSLARILPVFDGSFHKLTAR